jgi:CRP-like cAMP-binding protein
VSQQLDALREFNRIPILSSLTDQEIFEFIRACKVRKLAPGETLFREGDAGRSMFIVGEGSIDVLVERKGGRERVATVGARDVIGELSLLDPAPRSATALVTSAATVYEVSADEFDTLLSQDHPAAFKIARAAARLVCRRIRSVNTRIEEELAGGKGHAPARSVSSTGDVLAVGTPRHQSTANPRAAERGPTGPRHSVTSSEGVVVAPRPMVSRSSTAAQPAAAREPSPTGVFRSLISRFWKDES